MTHDPGQKRTAIYQALADLGMPLCRDRSERMDEEVYRSIPALAGVANALSAIGNKLSQEAREAMFFPKGRDQEMRTLMVEKAFHDRERMNNISPDLGWLASQKPADKSTINAAAGANDLWLGA